MLFFHVLNASFNVRSLGCPYFFSRLKNSGHSLYRNCVNFDPFFSFSAPYPIIFRYFCNKKDNQIYTPYLDWAVLFMFSVAIIVVIIILPLTFFYKLLLSIFLIFPENDLTPKVLLFKRIYLRVYHCVYKWELFLIWSVNLYLSILNFCLLLNCHSQTI